jgi:hypothetical protein
LSIDVEERCIEARMDTERFLPIGQYQRGDQSIHPRHVSAPELVLLTGNLGALHAWFIHGCRWDEGWVGFGNRIWRADFRDIVHIGPELLLSSKETRTRVGASRIVMRLQFEFRQEGRSVYRGDQTAIFLLDKTLHPA